MKLALTEQETHEVFQTILPALQSQQQAIIVLQAESRRHDSFVKEGMTALAESMGQALHETDIRIIAKAREDQQREDFKQFTRWLAPIGIIAFLSALMWAFIFSRMF